MRQYELIKQAVPKSIVEALIQETFKFRHQFYTEENLEKHIAYLSDKQPHRTSTAFATTFNIHDQVTLPNIDLNDPRINVEYPNLVDLQSHVCMKLGLGVEARVLFNIQEYYAEAEPVPKHHDGELLKFNILESGELDIKRSIRPEKVAVLTLVNDSNGGGTRLYTEGTEELVQAEAGDLLIFDNIGFKHGVDRLSGTVRRPDGLLRMIIGWRSLNQNCWYFDACSTEGVPANFPITRDSADKITQEWLIAEWPLQWQSIKNSMKRAAF